MIKKINFRLDKKLEYYNIINILRTNGIILFHQNLLLDIKNNLDLNYLFLDKNYIWKFLKKKIIKKIISKQFYYIIKNFRNILVLNNVFDLINVEQLLNQNNNLILGYYINNIFFLKKDWNIQKIEKKLLLEKMKKKIIFDCVLKKKILFILKIFLKKSILILKKNGNN